jgi:hypothetical protein
MKYALKATLFCLLLIAACLAPVMAAVYENHTVTIQNNCTRSVYVVTVSGPNGPPFDASGDKPAAKGCTSCSCGIINKTANMPCPSTNCSLTTCGTTPCNSTGAIDLPYNGGFEVQPGVPFDMNIPSDTTYGGNLGIWGRYGCNRSTFQGKEVLDCDTGNCPVQIKPGYDPRGVVECGGKGADFPATKIEIFFATGADTIGNDFYDLSLVDGYNLPVSIKLAAGVNNKTCTSTDSQWCQGKWCTESGAGQKDLNPLLPSNLSLLAYKNPSNTTVGILSACKWGVYDNGTRNGVENSSYCCTGTHGTPATCDPDTWPAELQSSQFFEQYYPDAYSFAFNDNSHTFQCKGTDARNLTSYIVTFCPANKGTILPASVGDSAWVDENGNGIRDQYEPRLSGVKVSLLNATMGLEQAMFTNSQGQYQFNNLNPGRYSLKVQIPAGYKLTTPLKGSDPLLDSDIQIRTKMVTFVLKPGQSDSSRGIGLVPCHSCQGTI